MKYINGKELMMFLQPPITRLSVFEAETVDVALQMCADAFKKMEKDFNVRIDFPTFKYQVLKTMSEFLNTCIEMEHIGLQNPRQRIDAKQFEALGIDIRQWPKHLQKQNAENYFIMQYVLAYADILYRYLLDSTLPRTLSHQLANESAMKLAHWIDVNCIKKCDYACIRRNRTHGYCTLCSFMIQPLPCPLKKEISYQQLMVEPDEIKCKRIAPSKGAFTKK